MHTKDAKKKENKEANNQLIVRNLFCFFGILLILISNEY